jgi:hypothetical protein
MNNRQRKTLTAIFSTPPPATIEWSEVESLVKALGGRITHNQGSKVRIDLHQASLNIHSPHPQKEVKHYAVRLLREFFQKAGVEP